MCYSTNIMESLENTRIPLDIPADQRHYVTYALMSLAKHIKFAGDDFIKEAVMQIPELSEYLNSTFNLVDITPKAEPYMLSPQELLAFFISFDLSYKAMNGPMHFDLMMQYQDDKDDTCVATFDDAFRNKERTLELLEPFLETMRNFAEKTPDAHYLHQYLRIAKRLPLPGSKGLRQEYAPFDEPFRLHKLHPEFRLGKYHNSPIKIILHRNIMVDMNFHLVFHLVKTITEVPDNLPSRIITAYFPDFQHYFNHMFENIKLQEGSNEQFGDIEYIKQNSFNQVLPEVVFGSIYLAFDFTLKLCFSNKGYTNYPALLVDRYGVIGKQMFGQQAASNAISNALQTATPILTDYFSFLTNELDHKGSTLVADYKVFSQQVDWWD